MFLCHLIIVFFVALANIVLIPDGWLEEDNIQSLYDRAVLFDLNDNSITSRYTYLYNAIDEIKGYYLLIGNGPSLAGTDLNLL